MPAGSDVALCSTIWGAPPPTYQWRYKGLDLPWKTTECLWLPSVSWLDVGQYELVASNSVGVLVTDPITLNVDYYAPTRQVYVCGGSLPAPAGSSVTLCASIAAAPPPSYQWQFNEVDLPGQTGWSLSVFCADTNQSGSYRVVARNDMGTFASAPIAVSVVYLPPTARITLTSRPHPHDRRQRAFFVCANILRRRPFTGN